MPRVVYPDYVHRRTRLHSTWRYAPHNFTMLSAREQWDLHFYFRFAEKLDQRELYQHWQSTHDEPTSLPQRAGRAYAYFERFLIDKPVTLKPVVKTAKAKSKQKKKEEGTRVVRVRGLVRPRPDAAKLARVLIALTRDSNKQEGENT